MAGEAAQDGTVARALSTLCSLAGCSKTLICGVSLVLPFGKLTLRLAQGDKEDVTMSAACPELAEGNHRAPCI